MFQTADDVQMPLSCAEPFSGAEPNMVCFHPGMAKCKHSIPQSAWAQF